MTVEGITKLTATDIRYAENMGYRIKLLGITKRTERGIELRVHPALVPMRRLLANVEGVMNAVVVKGDAVGSTLFYGRGAGAEPTASAVVADLVDIVRMTAAGDAQALKPAEHNQETTQLGWLPMSQTVSSIICAFLWPMNRAYSHRWLAFLPNSQSRSSRCCSPKL